MIACICDEWPQLSPLEAVREWMVAPAGFLEDVIEARHYARAKRLIEASPEKPPTGDLFSLVHRIEALLVQEEMERMKAEREACPTA